MTEVPDSASAMRTEKSGAEQRPDDGSQADVVELSVPAQTAYVSVLRSTAAALASRLDFTLDEIEDLRIAVDEASALLLAQAAPGTQMTCAFRLAGDELVVSVSATSGTGAPQLPATDSFAWMVLTALVGPVDADVDADNRRVSLTLTKRAEAVRKSASKFAGEVHDLDKARNARAEGETGSESGTGSGADSDPSGADH